MTRINNLPLFNYNHSVCYYAREKTMLLDKPEYCLKVYMEKIPETSPYTNWLRSDYISSDNVSKFVICFCVGSVFVRTGKKSQPRLGFPLQPRS